MGIFYIIFAIISSLGFLEVISNAGYLEDDRLIIKHQKFQKIFYIVACSLLFVMAILRSEYWGTDTASYKTYYFDYYGFVTLKELFAQIITRDIGFDLLGKFIRIFTNEYWAWRAAISSLGLILYFIVIYKDSSYPTLSLLFIYSAICSYSFFILRMGIALAICFVAKFFYKKGNVKRAVLLIFLATTFHKSSIFAFYPMLAMKIIERKKFTLKKVIMQMVLLTGAFAIFVPVMAMLYQRGLYTTDNDFQGDGMLILLIGIFIVIGWIINSQGLREINNIAIDFNFALVAIMMQIGALFLGILYRAGFYFSDSLSLLLPNIIASKKKVSARVLLYFIYLIGCLLWFTLFDGMLTHGPFLIHQF